MILPSDPSSPRLTHELMQDICSALGELPTNIFVIYHRKANSVLFDKMTAKPVNNRNIKVLEQVNASLPLNARGRIVSLHEALRLVIKHQPKS